MNGRGHCDLWLNLSSSHLRGALRCGNFYSCPALWGIRARCYNRDYGTELGKCCLGQGGPWCAHIVLVQWRSTTAWERWETCCCPGCCSNRHGVGDNGCWQGQEAAISVCDKEEGSGLWATSTLLRLAACWLETCGLACTLMSSTSTVNASLNWPISIITATNSSNFLCLAVMTRQACACHEQR